MPMLSSAERRMVESKISSKPVILATLAVVVAAFVGATGYAELRASRTHMLTTEIAGNEAPSIIHLAAARADLRDLQRVMSTHVFLSGLNPPQPIEPIHVVRERLRSDLHGYFALPALPGERELWGNIERELADVDIISGQILEAIRERRFTEAQNLVLGQLPPAIDEEADAMIAAIQLNARRVSDVASQIEIERKTRLLWVFGLDGISVGLAVLLALLALRTVTRQEALVRRRSEELEAFAGRVAHDLLNPIAAAELSLAAADHEGLDPARQRTAYARARRSLGRARQLVADLLAFAQAGARPTGPRAAFVKDVVDGVLEELRGPAEERGIALALLLPPAPISVGCSPGVLASLISNLVRNAIKHMGDRPRKQVQLRVSTDEEWVRFEVEDTGPGLRPALLSRVFDPYVRGTGTLEPGLGLGLATVRRLVEGHDGRYGVRSQVGQGAVFWFELPAAPHPHPDDDDSAEEAAVIAPATRPSTSAAQADKADN